MEPLLAILGSLTPSFWQMVFGGGALWAARSASYVARQMPTPDYPAKLFSDPLGMQDVIEGWLQACLRFYHGTSDPLAKLFILICFSLNRRAAGHMLFNVEQLMSMHAARLGAIKKEFNKLPGAELRQQIEESSGSEKP